MKNDGTAAEEAFVKRIMRQPNSWVERVRDAKDLRGINRGRKVGDFAKPCDFLVTQKGLLSYAEVKSTLNPRRFPFSQVGEAQRSAALKQAAIGGPYRFYIFSYTHSKWYIMDCQVFAAAIERGDSSIKFEDLIEW